MKRLLAILVLVLVLFALPASAHRDLGLCEECIEYFESEQDSCNEEYEGRERWIRRCRNIYDKYIQMCVDEFCAASAQ